MLFEDIARYIEHMRDRKTPNGGAQANGEPSSKKRKLDTHDHQDKTVVFEAKDLSFQIPLRKKLTLEITRGNNDVLTIQARNAGTNSVEYEGLSSSIGEALLAEGATHC